MSILGLMGLCLKEILSKAPEMGMGCGEAKSNPLASFIKDIT